MPEKSSTRSLFHGAVAAFRSSWKPLLLTDLAYKLIAFVVLTPVVAFLFRTLLAVSGNSAVSDLDILYYFLGPIGWVCAIVVGALWLAIVALEQASLLAVLHARDAGQAWGTVAALQFALSNAWRVIQVTARIVAFTLLAVTPFVIAAAAVYYTLLTRHDINYYLREKPPAFQAAIAIGGILLALAVAVLLRLFTGWFFALPLVLFQRVPPREALRQSIATARGRRGTILVWVGGWALAMSCLSAGSTALVALAGRAFVPESTNSLRLLTVAVGFLILLGAVVQLAVNLVSTTTFATILYQLYRQWRGGTRDEIAPVERKSNAEPALTFHLTRGRLLFAAVVGCLAAVAAGMTALKSVQLEDEVQIMAHRGASKAAPENTLAAFRHAIEAEADWIELDVQETADGEVVVFHDSDFMKLAGRDLRIWNATRDDLQAIDVGGWFAPEFEGERVPTLAEVLDLCKGKIGVNIELKYYGHDEHLEQRVARIVESRAMASDVMVMSLKRAGVRKMKALRPDWKVGLLMSVSAGKLKNLEADFLAVNAAFANRRLIRAAHDAGKQVCVWTVNDAETMSTMISRGVDGLLTDDPALARSVLQQRARMSVPERLLLEVSGLLRSTPDTSERTKQSP